VAGLLHGSALPPPSSGCRAVAAGEALLIEQLWMSGIDQAPPGLIGIKDVYRRPFDKGMRFRLPSCRPTGG
jgi:hypothetical protein